jgi:hypothetical protein
MRHPAEFFIKYIIIHGGPNSTDDRVLFELHKLGFLPPADTNYLGFLRQEIEHPPEGFEPLNKTHRPSMSYLRNEGVYELFFADQATQDAQDALADTFKRGVIEQVILSRIDLKLAAVKLNKKYNWFLTEDMLIRYRHFFWNMNLLTFDQWGRYLYERSSMYDNYMTLLRADPRLAFYHLRFEQSLESKALIKRTQEIAYFTLEEVAQVPGSRADKVKAIGILGKVVTDCHYALSTSDMAMSGVLKQMERFRVVPSEEPAKPIHLLAPGGNYTGSGVIESKDEDEDQVH